MATLEKETTVSSSALIEPVPLELLYEANHGGETFTDHSELERALPNLSSPDEPSISLVSEDTIAHVDRISLNDDTIVQVDTTPADTMTVNEGSSTVQVTSVDIVPLENLQEALASVSRYIQISSVSPASMYPVLDNEIETDDHLLQAINEIVTKTALYSPPIYDVSIEKSSQDGFLSLIETYKEAEISYSSTLEHIEGSLISLRSEESLLWSTKHGIAIQSRQSSRTGKTISAKVEFSHKSLNEGSLNKFEEAIDFYIDLESFDLVDCLFDRYISVFMINLHISATLSKSLILKEESRSDLIQIREMVQTLLFYEQHISIGVLVHNNGWKKKFLLQLQDWILNLFAALIERGEFLERVFLLKQVLSYPHVGSDAGKWVLQGIQFLPSNIDNYCSIFGIFTQAAKSQNRFTEPDLIAIFEQIQFDAMTSKLFPWDNNSIERVTELFGRSNNIISLLLDLAATTKWFPQFVKYLAEGALKVLQSESIFLSHIDDGELFWVVQLLFDTHCLHLVRWIFTHPDRNMQLMIPRLPLQNLSHNASWRLLLAFVLGYQNEDLSNPELIPGYFNKNGEYVLKTPVYSSENLLPRSKSVKLTQPALNEIDGTLAEELFQRFQHISCLQDWSNAIISEPLIQTHFLRTLKGTGDSFDQESYVSGLSKGSEVLYRLVSIASVGKFSGGGIAIAVIRELLQVTFLSPTLSEIVIPVCELVGDVCNEHPQLVTVVLQLIDSNMDAFQAHGELLVTNLPIERWIMEDMDLDVLRHWLKQAGSFSIGLAMKIIDRMNWNCDANGQTFLNASTHRYMACILTELHFSRRYSRSFEGWRKWVPLTQDYHHSKESDRVAQWCWRKVLGLCFYRNFKPLIPLTDINNSSDTSIEEQLRVMWELSKESDQIDSADPMVAYMVLMLTNHPIVNNWTPLKVLIFHCNILTNGHFDDALYRVVFDLFPNYALNGDWSDLPKAADWLNLFLPTFKDISRGLLNNVVDKISVEGISFAGFPELDSLNSPRFERLLLVLTRQMLQCSQNNIYISDTLNFWLKAISQIPDWNSNAYYLRILNTLIMIAESTCYQLVTGTIRKFFNGQAIKLIYKCETDLKCESVTCLSIIPARISGTLFSKPDVSCVVSGCEWLIFHSLLIETGYEYPLWLALGDVLPCDDKPIDNSRHVIESIRHQIDSKTAFQYMHVDFKKISQFRIYRWANYALSVPADHPLLMLFWQIFFHLYFGKSGSKIFGFKFLVRDKKNSRRSSLRDSLCTRAKELAVVFRNSMLLSEVFTAFALWLRDPTPQSWLGDGTALANLPQEYCIGRLSTLLHSPLLQLLHSNLGSGDSLVIRRHLWIDLIDYQPLLESFCPKPSSKVLVKKRRVSMTVPLPCGEYHAIQKFVFTSPVSTRDVDVFTLDPETVLDPLLKASRDHFKATKKLQGTFSAMMKALPQLYKVEKHTSKVEKVENVGSDKEVLTFEIPYDESVLVNSVQDRLKELWKQTSLKSPKSELFLELCRTVSLIRHVVSELELLNATSASSDTCIQVSRCGMTWFRYLISIENSISRGYPPLQRIVWASLTKLGKIFAKKDPVATRTILDAMLKDPDIVPLLAPLFYPPIELVYDLYYSVWSRLFQIPVETGVAILKRFEFESWIALCPSLEVRESFLLLIASVIRKSSWGTHSGGNDTVRLFQRPCNPNMDILVFHTKLLRELCQTYFQQHFETCVMVLVGARIEEHATTVTPAHPTVWKSILSIHDSCWDSLTFSSLCEICHSLNSYFLLLRHSGALIHQWEALDLIDDYLSLCNHLSLLLCKECNETNYEVAFSVVNELFHPWICSTYQSPDGSLSQQSPWNVLGQQKNKYPEIVVQVYVLCINRLAQLDLRLLDSTWKMYFETFIQGSTVEALGIVTSGLLELSWEHWKIDEAGIKKCSDAITSCSRTHPFFQFIQHVVIRLDWEASMKRLTFENHQSFYAAMMVLSAELFCKASPIHDGFHKFCRNLAPMIPLHSVDPETFHMVLKLVHDTMPTSVIPHEHASDTRASAALCFFSSILNTVEDDEISSAIELEIVLVRFLLDGVRRVADNKRSTEKKDFFWNALPIEVFGLLMHQSYVRYEKLSVVDETTPERLIPQYLRLYCIFGVPVCKLSSTSLSASNELEWSPFWHSHIGSLLQDTDRHFAHWGDGLTSFSMNDEDTVIHDRRRRSYTSSLLTVPSTGRLMNVGVACSAIIGYSMPVDIVLLKIVLSCELPESQTIDLCEHFAEVWISKGLPFCLFMDAFCSDFVLTNESVSICQRRGAWMSLYSIYVSKIRKSFTLDLLDEVGLTISTCVAIQLKRGTYLNPPGHRILPLIYLWLETALNCSNSFKAMQSIVSVLKQFITEPSLALSNIPGVFFKKMISAATGTQRDEIHGISHPSGYIVTPCFRVYVQCLLLFLYANTLQDGLRLDKSTAVNVISSEFCATVEELATSLKSNPVAKQSISRCLQCTLTDWKMFASFLDSELLDINSAQKNFEIMSKQ